VVTALDGTVLWNSTQASAAEKTICIGKSQDSCGSPCFWDKVGTPLFLTFYFEATVSVRGRY
jgi:hypothetical protein